MKYRLLVLTHGSGETLAPTLDSFGFHVTPPPTDTLIIRDGPGGPIYVPPWFGVGYAGQPWSSQLGFCEAVRRAWVLACLGNDANFAMPRPSDDSFVFWLEHDFVFTRPVDLARLALPLKKDETLAQMRLVRGPINAREEAAGGVVKNWGVEVEEHGKGKNRYLTHSAHFSTNPSLMRVGFMQKEGWPDDVREDCEGTYGRRLVERGYRFGAWGDGEPWVEHIGVRDGFGY